MRVKKPSILLSLTPSLLALVGTLTLLGAGRGGAAAVHAQGNTLYVAPGGNCGSGVSPCYGSVQEAVDAASPGDEIRVAAGSYTDISVRPRCDVMTTGVVTQVVYISKTVTIRGGYTTTNWTAPDPNIHPTVLDAQGKGRVLYITGDISPTVEGLHLTGGNAAGLGGDPYGGDAGGGVYLITATATISNCRVYSNTAQNGGGLSLYGSPAMLHGNTVLINTASAGGGLYLYESDAMLSGNTVLGNMASYGGGLDLVHSAATLSGNIVSGNMAGTGGGLYLYYSDATLSGNTVLGNTATSWGGGLGLLYSDATLSGNIVSGNTATYHGGGGLILTFSAAVLRGNIVSGNTATHGGGLRLYQSDATLDNNVIADNQISESGAGLYIMGSSPRLRHNTIARNIDGDGSGVYVTDAGGIHSTVALTDTILVSHTVGITVTAGSKAMLEGTLWGSGSWANGTDWGGDGAIVTGTVNVWGDPAFVNPDGGDYHIASGSAAIDAGVDAGVTDDIDGDTRPWGSGYDIGADEFAIYEIYLPLVLRNH